jgi:glycosyltransferase involved in cell wall biosynthesis
MKKKFPLLSIVIPTYNRKHYITLSLKQILKEKSLIGNGEVELIVNDDFSNDETEKLVKSFINQGLNMQFNRNSKNLGLDLNVAKSINQARGKYVLVLGDDDLLLNGSIRWILRHIKKENYGVICFSAYGYEKNYLEEIPASLNKIREFNDPGEFLIAIGPLVTFTSTCVFNKALLGNIDARKFCGCWMVHVPLIIKAAVKAHKNIYCTKYLIAAKRNNSGGYNFIKVFVQNLGDILDTFKDNGISKYQISKFEKKMIFSYLPYYLLKQRILEEFSPVSNLRILKKRYSNYLIFWVWLAPISILPRFMAIIWGSITTLIGRIYLGQLIRAVYFIKNKFNSNLNL